MIRADMHTHTYFSDGELTPEDVAERARLNGLDMVVVTDHDTMEGCARAKAACGKNNLITVSATEVSSYDVDVKVHLLAYGLDIGSAAYKNFYSRCMEGAKERTADILKKLRAVGVDIPLEEVMAARFSDKTPLHSSHVARAGAKLGYEASSGAFYVKYLNYGKAGFSCVCRPDPESTVDMIHAAGGICSLAHPGRITLEKDGQVALIRRLLSHGLDGIEAVYSEHTDIETAYYKEIAQKFNLLITGGSDTHYPDGKRKIGTPEFYPDERLLAALKLI